jgi:hypothetical protein
MKLEILGSTQRESMNEKEKEKGPRSDLHSWSGGKQGAGAAHWTGTEQRRGEEPNVYSVMEGRAGRKSRMVEGGLVSSTKE